MCMCIRVYHTYQLLNNYAQRQWLAQDNQNSLRLQLTTLASGRWSSLYHSRDFSDPVTGAGPSLTAFLAPVLGQLRHPGLTLLGLLDPSFFLEVSSAT